MVASCARTAGAASVAAGARAAPLRSERLVVMIFIPFSMLTIL